jgi:hypothetical protein
MNLGDRRSRSPAIRRHHHHRRQSRRLKSRPKIRLKIETDLDILAYAANLLHERRDSLRLYNLPGMVGSIRRTLQHELDFSREARHMKIARNLMADLSGIHIPRVNGGGNNMARASLTGALAGAQVGLSGIPQRFIDGLADGERLLEMALKAAEIGEAPPK